MTFNPVLKFESDYPLGEYYHVDLPNDYDPQKVILQHDFASCISPKSLFHRRWFIHKDDFKEFDRQISSGEVGRY